MEALYRLFHDVHIRHFWGQGLFWNWALARFIQLILVVNACFVVVDAWNVLHEIRQQAFLKNVKCLSDKKSIEVKYLDL
jgi:hypothetical protein